MGRLIIVRTMVRFNLTHRSAVLLCSQLAVLSLCAEIILTPREQCDSCLTFMESQQTVWATVGGDDPEAERQKKFQLTDATRANISSLCEGPTYTKRYSEAMKEGCTQLVQNAMQLVTTPFLQGGSNEKLMMNRKWRGCYQWCKFNQTTNIQYYQYAGDCEACYAMSIDIAFLLRRSKSTSKAISASKAVSAKKARRVIYGQRPDVCEMMSQRHERGSHGFKEHCEDIWGEHENAILSHIATTETFDLKWARELCVEEAPVCSDKTWKLALETARMPHDDL